MDGQLEFLRNVQISYAHFCPLYINKLFSLVSSKLLVFADDIKLYHTIHSPEDYLILQNDIDVFLEWSNHWLLYSSML